MLCVVQSYEELFGLTPTNFSDVDQALKELTVHRQKWEQLAEFERASEGWMTGSCAELSPEEIQTKVGCAVKDQGLADHTT